MYQNFDRDYLDQKFFVEKRNARDELLRNGGIDPVEFREWLRENDVENETGTDEYRETQPSKGLSYVSEFLSDYAPGGPAVLHMLQLTLRWLRVVEEARTYPDEYAKKHGIGAVSYAGDIDLKPILNLCFDFLWEQGRVGLYYDELENDLIAQWMEDHS